MPLASEISRVAAGRGQTVETDRSVFAGPDCSVHLHAAARPLLAARSAATAHHPSKTPSSPLPGTITWMTCACWAGSAGNAGSATGTGSAGRAIGAGFTYMINGARDAVAVASLAAGTAP